MPQISESVTDARRTFMQITGRTDSLAGSIAVGLLSMRQSRKGVMNDMWYVYCRHIKSGREDCVNRIYDTAEEAIKHIALCYRTDKDLHQLGEYYYFMKRH
jgi:hypothetical protein